MTNFEDIRPYHDDEVKPAISHLLNDAGFIDTVSAFKLAGKPRWLQRLLRPLVRQRLGKELGSINSVKGVQTLCEKYLHRVIKTTTTNLTFSGLENLSADRPYFFISNHRDIVMDPALVNFALYHHGLETPQLAIGDNLLQKPFVSDLMRLNKCFIVKRSATGVREKLQAFNDLSSYIHHAHKTGNSTWIAQKEGRAKDGIDSTDPAIIKMLYMSQRKSGLSFSQYMNWLHIVPISISYEYNPCDLVVSRELHEKRTAGSYKKAEGEDIRSITTGITGLKGNVHVAFGKPLAGDLNDAETVATQIDQQIIQLYRCHDSNYIAAELSDAEAGKLCDHPISEQKKTEFIARLNSCDEEMKDIFLAMYANPALRKAATNANQ